MPLHRWRSLKTLDSGVLSSSPCPKHAGLLPQEAVRAFRSGKAQVLAATDVASRGLHIARLPYIVSYDFPSRLDTYVHRVGRTGRLAAAGHALSFFTRNLAPLAAPLVALLQVGGVSAGETH